MVVECVTIKFWVLLVFLPVEGSGGCMIRKLSWLPTQKRNKSREHKEKRMSAFQYTITFIHACNTIFHALNSGKKVSVLMKGLL